MSKKSYSGLQRKLLSYYLFYLQINNTATYIHLLLDRCTMSLEVKKSVIHFKFLLLFSVSL